MNHPFKPYPHYKPSGIEWLGDIPEHWEVLKLRNILTSVAERNRSDLPLLSVVREQGVILRDITNKDENHNFIPDDLTNYKIVRKGQFAMNKMKAWQGSYGVSRHNGIVSPAYFVFSFSQAVDPDYFHLAIRSKAYIPFFAQASDGVRIGQWDLSRARMREIPFILPPPSEQALIARYLDGVVGRIRRYVSVIERRIEGLQEYRRAIIHRTVTRGLDPNVPLKPTRIEWLGDIPKHWEVRRLRNVVFMRVSNVDKHIKEGEIPVRLCNYVDVYKNDYIDEQMDFMRATATAAEIRRFRLEKDDVLITKDSETWDDIGVPALVTKPASDLILGYHLALFRPHGNEVIGSYLLRALQSKGLAYQFHIEAKGVTRYGLSHLSIKSVRLPIPPLSEQAAIAEYLDKATAGIDAAIRHAQREHTLLREYRTALIAHAVTGKLDLRDI